MPEPDNDLLNRLDSLGARAATDAQPMPAVLSAAVIRNASRRVPVPMPALAAAAAVVLAGAWLVVFGVPSLPRLGAGSAHTVARGVSSTLLGMMERFNHAGSIDDAVPPQRQAALPASRIYRPLDARDGAIPD